MKINRRELFKGSAPLALGAALANCESKSSRPLPPHRWIDQSLCIGCGSCVPHCPMGAIRLKEKSEVVADQCAECGVCFRSRVCPQGAIKAGDLKWPRTLREVFSNPVTEHKSTGVAGRGTEGIKTNDSTNRYQPGFMGVFVELGRPVLGARFYDVEKALKKFIGRGFQLVAHNPVSELVAEPRTGALKPEILNEKVISVLLEFVLPQNAGKVLPAIIRELAGEVETVFNVSIALRALENGESPFGQLFPAGTFTLANGKVNLGLAQGIVERKS